VSFSELENDTLNQAELNEIKNAIGKYWLRKLDIKFNEKYFVCKCSNVSTLNLNMLPFFLQNMYPIMVKIT
jgi:hypothetical protein